MNLAMWIAALCSVIGAGTGGSTPVKGDYVEARTASVFAGPCHYNGELVTTGCDAVMAWRFKSGSWQGVDLSGVRVMGVVSSDENLGQTDGTRKSEFVIDAPSARQAKAAMAAVVWYDGGSLGSVAAVHRGSVSFQHVGKAYQVNSPGFGAMDVKGMPNDECCKQPNLVWYSPLAHLSWRKVGFTNDAKYLGGTVGEPWERSDENGAFYGEFSY
jgi:Protein of unknown function (DUF1326)